ncbi:MULTISPECIES: NADH-quinone oxidoreductase subunit L [Sphingobacterium]|uniref:NADH-quinone oxidoreductase subunit 5 family protein n=1 Tax=Sphingobacterium TaxID=28453 RepID=UPI00104FC1C5|nr:MULTISPECIES: NADH-quinone oxidoreductase subunit L [Sphingobacterium]MCW2262599.1 NADH-quinone oxidoreductase subunit L [Sphingobacterium kitahiroshimense]TCR12653.1 NADH dehydrogenase subunit L [Sphingobacterium sp. JUb78]
MNYLFDISPINTALFALAMPLLAFLYQAVVGKKDQSGLVGTAAIILSFIFSLITFLDVWNAMPLSSEIRWFTIGNTTFTVGLLLNNLSSLMLLLVSTIAVPVHIYSKSYMHDDTGIHRYWMYLSLFCFAMLGLVIMNNLLLMYVFWELVGFASYLLIGFWYTKDAAVQANKKAFLVNRIGDLGFLIGIAIVYAQFGSLNLVNLFGNDELIANTSIENGLWISPHNSMDAIWLTITGLAFFLGAMAKSAQFPLHVWLPDAMEGPTSVSSLIHAATMVAAGVFLMSTLFPLFNETVLLTIAIIGTITATTAAYFALGQYDIKKILAFSTISQLGYMMVGIGIGTWDAAMFHLLTHAFFKCLLFLCAGAVIHEMAHLKAHSKHDFDPQDLRNMGGLRHYMPQTFVLMTIASLALAGFPLTSGYLSKDSIIISAFEWASTKGALFQIVPVTLIIVSIMTSFYIGRLIFKAFFSELRIKNLLGSSIHLSESPKLMLWPMYFLGMCCFFPLFSINPISYHDSWIMDGLLVDYPYEANHLAHLVIPILLTVGALSVWILGWKWYAKGQYPLNENSLANRLSLHQGYLNSFNETIIVNSILKLSALSYWLDRNIVDGFIHSLTKLIQQLAHLSHWLDKHIVDGLVNAIGKIALLLGNFVRSPQNGRLQTYLYSVFLLVIVGLIYLLLR